MFIRDYVAIYHDGDRQKAAQAGSISVYQLNNLISQERKVLPLHGGGFILITKRTIIFKEK